MAHLLEYYNTGANSLAGIYGTQQMGQQFTPSAPHSTSSVKLYLIKKGTPGTLTVVIKATDGSGNPTGSALATGTTDGNTLPLVGSPEWREITFVSPATLSASAKYVILCSGGVDSDNYVAWRMDITSPTYSGGNNGWSSDSGATWDFTDVGQDFLFEEWGIVAYSVTAAVSRGHALTVGRATTTSRSSSVSLGLQSISLIEINISSFLCVASQSNGSIKTLDRVGSSWDICAKTAAGAVDAAWFAQYDNRLCVLNYQNTGFSYSAVNDIITNWTNKPNFPNLPVNFTGMFVGKDASDNPILYFLTPKGMYYLDVFSNFVFGPTEVTWEEDNTTGKKGLYWKGDNYVAVGKGIYKLTGNVVTLIGPDMDDGLPEDMQGTITDMIGVGFWLVIAVDGGTGAKSSILKRYITGKHWHPVYVSTVGSRIKSLCWDSGTLYFGEGTNVKSLPFPTITDNVNALSTQTRAESGTLAYPWFHSVFETMSKTAFKAWATTKNCTASETITIHYRKNEETSWTSLGSFATSPRPTALAFGTAGVGVEFERIQLRASYARGGTTTYSPKIESLVLEYQVNPPTLWAWTMKIMATTAKDQKGATIIAALKTALETNTLLAFYPDGDKSSTVYYVRVKGMPGGEKGTEFGTEGIFSLTVIEVVG